MKFNTGPYYFRDLQEPSSNCRIVYVKDKNSYAIEFYSHVSSNGRPMGIYLQTYINRKTRFLRISAKDAKILVPHII